MVKGSRLAVIVGLMFMAVLVFWWFGLNEYRETVNTVRSLKNQMAVMEQHVHETERVLAAVKTLELQVREARSEADEEMARTLRYSGNDRIDRLERLLEADLARRNSAACPSTGGLSGASGEQSGAGTAESK